ncbi:DNA polymerase III subunit alpha [Jiulongibacter sp. NS-SX5]|uniref:DNA polymerase III subunit alpha n=1 Tax=Jiulongibacter sp. NS-SX5 TaxID=3463854 RepID=UPI00405A0510
MYLNCHTYFSLRYGTFSEKELLLLGQKYGQQVLVLTDINNTSGCMSFVRQSAKYNIRPVIGIDFRIGAEQLYVGIARNNDGFAELNEFLTKHSLSKKELPTEPPVFQHCFVIYPLTKVNELNKTAFAEHEFIGVDLDDLEYLHRSKWASYEHKMVFLHSVSFRHQQDYNVHRLLRAIDRNDLLSRLPPEAFGKKTEVFLEPGQIEEALRNHPIITENTHALLQKCSIYFDFSEDRPHQNLLSYHGNREQDRRLIRRLCKEGLRKRYDVITRTILKRVAKELDIIESKDYVAFFLVNWNIVEYAKGNGYYHVGRGSGANSIVAYLLGITDVDPIELDLYFERFMNLYRANPPDFDIDFSSRDRDDVTRHIFECFGRGMRAALLATYNTFQYSGAVRELGKVFGLPKSEIDALSNAKIPEKTPDHIQSLILKYAGLIMGMPNHLSVHSSGIVISEKPLYYFSAMDMPPKGFPTVQFDMEIAEDVGLFKYDILGQRGLGKIKDTLGIIAYNRPDLPPIDIRDVKSFFKDPKINEQISLAQCIGCFYVESPAMRMLLRKLRVDNYLGLVAASSIIRPGVSKSGMMREYILRHRHPERIKEKAHKVMLDIMPETYGVMVYQEDVIKVAHYFAGLSLGEADQLRRGMSGKYRSREEFAKVKQKFISNCRQRGIEESMIHEVWAQTESFAGYAFAKGHSASYAVESYQSLYLKTYFPLEYMVAVLNNGGGFYRVETYIHEARMNGGRIHAPHINISRRETIIKGRDIYLGFQHLHGMDTSLMISIVKEREENGDFKSLEDFLERVSIGPDQVEILLRIGSFNFSGVNKRELLWKALYKLNREPARSIQNPLFKVKTKSFELPKMVSSEMEDTFDQIELLGFPLCDPFALLETPPENELLAADMVNFVNKNITIYGYMVTVKNTKTAKGTIMKFGTFLDRAGHWIDTVHFPPVAAKFPFRGKGVYRLTGKVVAEFDFLSLEVTDMNRLDYLPDARYQAEDG